MCLRKLQSWAPQSYLAESRRFLEELTIEDQAFVAKFKQELIIPPNTNSNSLNDAGCPNWRDGLKRQKGSCTPAMESLGVEVGDKLIVGFSRTLQALDLDIGGQYFRESKYIPESS